MVPVKLSQLITEPLARLAEHRPFFYSEADFQHAFAFEIHKLHPDAEVRLEYPLTGFQKRAAMDMLIRIGKARIAFELKYWTRRCSLQHGNDHLISLSNTAQDQARYDFLKDISRMELAVATGQADAGIALALTNDQKFWIETKNVTIDSHFRLHHGRKLTGELSWGANAGHGTVKQRESSIIIAGRYDLHWRDYSSVGTSIGNQFRFLTVNIVKPSTLAVTRES